LSQNSQKFHFTKEPGRPNIDRSKVVGAACQQILHPAWRQGLKEIDRLEKTQQDFDFFILLFSTATHPPEREFSW
jgi:hypothetical protein